MEFLWQEGHTAHATYDDAQAETMRMLGVYADFAINDAAIPVIQGRKSNQERFAGAMYSFSIEAMMRDGKALQSGTSHNLGQNFAKAFEIQFTDEDNNLQYCWTTSWGLSTRMVGAVVMTHGDDQGLRLPPKLAPIQVVIVPIYRNDDERGPVMDTVNRIAPMLKDTGIRVHVDARNNVSTGFKFNDWEMRGVPIRLEIGPKDVAKNSVALARRDIPGKAGKEFVSQDGLVQTLRDRLAAIQANLLQQATEFRDSHLHTITDGYAHFIDVINGGEWALARFCGSRPCEEKVKEAASAASRCFPLDQPHPGETGKCIICGGDAQEMAYFAKSY
jgi:prolyl-tRNA synthetase